MPARLRVYCARPLGDTTAEALKSAITAGDLYTTAEGFGIEDEEEAVDEALEGFDVEPFIEGETSGFFIRYGTTNRPPMRLVRWPDPKRIEEERREALKQLGPRTDPGRQRVREHLARVVDGAAVEMEPAQLRDMGIVLAGQAIEWLAATADGLIRDQNSDWWVMEDGVPTVIVGPKERP